MIRPFLFVVISTFLLMGNATFAQAFFQEDVYPSGNCTFKWYSQSRVLDASGAPLQAKASMIGNVGQTHFADSKTVNGVGDVTARVEPTTPDKKEHMTECTSQEAFYTYTQEGRIGPTLYLATGQQPTPPNSIPCSCDVAECEDCFENDPSPTVDLCEYFPDFCKRSGDPEPVNLINLCPPECTSPLVVDLGRDGFEFGGPERPVAFDLLRSGAPLKIQWVVPGGNEAFLVQDLNDNGVVDDGAELFGNGTRLYFEGFGLAPNGFVALAQFDAIELGGNNDGFISADDAVWRRLMLWLDSNADGLCEPDEMMSVSKSMITRLETIPREERLQDEHGNRLRYWADIRTEAGSLSLDFDMVDVFFKQVR